MARSRPFDSGLSMPGGEKSASPRKELGPRDACGEATAISAKTGSCGRCHHRPLLLRRGALVWARSPFWNIPAGPRCAPWTSTPRKGPYPSPRHSAPASRVKVAGRVRLDRSPAPVGDRHSGVDHHRPRRADSLICRVSRKAPNSWNSAWNRRVCRGNGRLLLRRNSRCSTPFTRSSPIHLPAG